jgi:hypothetical protein
MPLLETSTVVDEIADALRIIELRRYNQAEFHFDIAQSDEMIGDRRRVTRHYVTVNRDGHTPISYECGTGRAWVAKFSDDLAAGQFG